MAFIMIMMTNPNGARAITIADNGRASYVVRCTTCEKKKQQNTTQTHRDTARATVAQKSNSVKVQPTVTDWRSHALEIHA